MKLVCALSLFVTALLVSCSPSMKDIQQQVASDSVKAYKLSKKAGDK